MARIESATVVKQPLEYVFAFLEAAENHARFIPNMAKFEQTTSGAFGRTGAGAHGLLSYFGLMKIPVQYEIIEYALNDRLAMKGQMGPIMFKDGYVLQKRNGGTEIKFWLDLLPTGWTLILAPFMGWIGRIHAWETLRNLKRELTKQEIGSPWARNDR